MNTGAAIHRALHQPLDSGWHDIIARRVAALKSYKHEACGVLAGYHHRRCRRRNILSLVRRARRVGVSISYLAFAS